MYSTVHSAPPPRTGFAWLTYPGPVKEDAHKHGRDGEVVDKGADLKHKVQLVVGGHELKIPWL